MNVCFIQTPQFRTCKHWYFPSVFTSVVEKSQLWTVGQKKNTVPLAQSNIWQSWSLFVNSLTAIVSRMYVSTHPNSAAAAEWATCWEYHNAALTNTGRKQTKSSLEPTCFSGRLLQRGHTRGHCDRWADGV